MTLVLSPQPSLSRSRSNVDTLTSKSAQIKEAGRLREVEEVRHGRKVVTGAGSRSRFNPMLGLTAPPLVEIWGTREGAKYDARKPNEMCPTWRCGG